MNKNSYNATYALMAQVIKDEKLCEGLIVYIQKLQGAKDCKDEGPKELNHKDVQA